MLHGIIWFRPPMFHTEVPGNTSCIQPNLPTLTIGMLSVSMFWSVEMGYTSPYLLSLGLLKSTMATVFAAGPLSRLVVQLLVGALADSLTLRIRKRRPYMLLGTAICVVAMLLLGFTRGVTAVFTGWDNTVVSLSLQSPPFRV